MLSCRLRTWSWVTYKSLALNLDKAKEPAKNPDLDTGLESKYFNVLLCIPVIVCKFISHWVHEIPKNYNHSTASANQLFTLFVRNHWLSLRLFISNHSSEITGISRDLIPSCLQISLSPLLLVDITAFRLNLFPSCCSLVSHTFVVRNLVGTWKTSCEFDWNSTDVNIVISRAIRLEDQLWIRWEFPRCQYQRVARFLCTILFKAY